MTAKVSGSRLARFWRLGWLSRRALPIALARLRGAADADPAERAAVAEALLDEHAEAADEAFRTLGSLKGLAVKIGQTLSYMDGALPEAYRATYQRVLSRLQAETPPLPWPAIERAIRDDLGRPPAEVFAELEETPFAAASIGQVHRGRLRGGREVAVKVQYPGIERAVRADLANAGLLRSLAAPLLGLAGRGAMARNLDDVLAELRARLSEELDYQHEAAMQERFRALLAGDPALRVPAVIAEASGRRVLTSELARGRTLREVCDGAPQAERDGYGVALTRFTLRSVYEFSLFNADPHPGNYLFPGDGSVVLLDFGCVKELPGWMVAAMRRYFRAAVVATRTGAAADWAEYDAALCAAYRIDPAADGFALYREFVLYCLAPYLRDEPFEFTPDWAGGSIDHVLAGLKTLAFDDGKRRLPRIPDLPPIPADYTFVSRLQWGFYSVLAMLRANANWHAMLPDDVRG